MKTTRKILSICLSFLMILGIAVSGTMAFEYIQQNIATRTAEASPQMKVKLIQSGDIFDNKDNPNYQIFPIREGLGRDEILSSSQFVRHNFSAKNTGDVEAYVRIVFAIPSSLDTENEDGKKALHIVESGSENWSDAAVVKDVVANGVLSNVYIYTYEHALDLDAIAQDSPILGFYLDSAVSNDAKGYFLGNKRLEVAANGTFKIPAAAQAVQTDVFNSIESAFSDSGIPNFQKKEDQQ